MGLSADNKLKIFNDPVYGFINIPDGSIFDIIETPFFQRLRHIRQLGMSHLVYPGALHTRFHHAMGAMYLMGQAIEILRFKGHNISESDALAVTQAILLHDIGHGPFSHALENTLVRGIGHEGLSVLFMERLNAIMPHSLKNAISIFQDTHPNKPLHQLVSSQLDMDRLDYLNRDSFFTGVSEGVISWDRIIKMLNIHHDTLVIDAKGIYSVEKFLIARRLMYWQVYLHKTVVAAESMLTSILRRAKQLARAGDKVPASAALERFLYKDHGMDDFLRDTTLLEDFSLLDDYDIFAAIKSWTTHKDPLLAYLSGGLVHRRLFRVNMQNEAFAEDRIDEIREKARMAFPFAGENEIDYLVMPGMSSNSAYDPGAAGILILSKDGTLTDIARASDQLNINVLSRPVEKFVLCYPKELT